MESIKNTAEQCMANWMEKDERDYTSTDIVCLLYTSDAADE